MNAVTLEAVKARHEELAAMIAQLQQQATTSRTIHVDAQDIVLAEGEHYAGAVLDEQGQHKHDLVLMAARPAKRLSWSAALAWAEEIGGALPTRQEQALLFTNCKPHLEPAWHWSSEQHEDDASSAWSCYFGHGLQRNDRKSFEGCSVAVRRL